MFHCLCVICQSFIPTDLFQLANGDEAPKCTGRSRQVFNILNTTSGRNLNVTKARLLFGFEGAVCQNVNQLASRSFKSQFFTQAAPILSYKCIYRYSTQPASIAPQPSFRQKLQKKHQRDAKPAEIVYRMLFDRTAAGSRAQLISCNWTDPSTCDLRQV